MKTLNPKLDLPNFWNQLKNAKHRVLLLDYDGTLAPFKIQRDRAFPYPGVRSILREMLAAQHSRLVLISGRATDDLIPLLELKPLPEIWGVHGMERLKQDGTYEMTEIDSGSHQLLKEVVPWTEKVGLHHRTEVKPGAVAIHWRKDENEHGNNIRKLISETWSQRLEGNNVKLKEFDGGIEFRASNHDKGTAVRTIFAEMNGDIAAAYLGDDFTDEDAFKAIKGTGISVLVREKLRPTKADIWLTPPGELLQFLFKWHEASGGES